MTDDFDVEALLDAPYQPKQTKIDAQSAAAEAARPVPTEESSKENNPSPDDKNEIHPQGEHSQDSNRRSSRSRSASRRHRSRHGDDDYYSSRRSSGGRSSRRSGSRRGDSRRHRDYDGRRSRSPPRDRDRRDRGRDRGREPEREREPKRESERPPRSPSPTVNEEDRDARTVFVMQISARCRTSELAEFFMQAGRVRDARIISDRNSRRSKGVGYVEFYSVESVESALKLSGEKLHGVPLIVQLTESEKNRAAEMASLSMTDPKTGRQNAAHRLYVGSIHFDLTEDDLRGVFEPFGALDFIQLQKDETGRSKGYAFIQYKDGADALLASTRMNGFELAGRTIKVSPVISGLAHGQGAPGMASFGMNMGVPMFHNKTLRTDMDESDAKGIALSSQARAELMQKLAREPSAQAVPATSPLAIRSQINIPAAITQCILLKNMFDPEEETEPNWDKEIEEDVKSECSKYGAVLHIYVEKDSQGEIYAKFDTAASAQAAVTALDGRWFAGKQVSAVYLSPTIYHTRFPKAEHARA